MSTDRVSSSSHLEATGPVSLVPAENFLEALGRFGVDLSLERMVELLRRLSDPQRGIPAIHVAGTNGKGSVCALVSQVLKTAGYRVGRYTSPHLVSWRERIWVSGEWICQEDWETLLFDLKQILDRYPPDLPCPTQFEVVTAAAWVHFRRQQVEGAVLEVGLGGRLDATNAAIDATVSVITSIGWDHWQRLGNSLAAIATEKAGIIKPGVPVVCGPQEPEVMAMIRAKATQLQAPLIMVEPAEWVGDSPCGHMCWRGKRYSLPLKGNVQLINGALALQTLQILREQGWSIPEESIRDGFAQTHWPGRLQQVEIGGKPVLLDGAHNQPSARALRDYLEDSGTGSITWFIGLLETKDIDGICKALLRPGDRLYTLPIADHAAMDPKQLLQVARQIEPQLAHSEAMETLATWQDRLCHEHLGDRPVLCGSLYLIGQVMERCLGWRLAE